MKRTAKRTLVLLTAAAMLLALMPAGAFAAEDYGLWICGEKVTSKNHSGPGWSFDLSTFTLKLKGFSYSGAERVAQSDGTDYYSAIFYTRGPKLTISLSGKNTIALKGVPKEKTKIYGLVSGADLTIAGDGSLDIVTDPISGDNTGIWAKYDLIVNSGTMHISTGGGKGSIPIECNGDLRINGGSLQLEAGPGDYPIAIWCDGDMTVKGGSVSAVCGNISQADLNDDAGRYTYGIRVKRSLTMEDGQIYAKAGDTGTVGEHMSIGLLVMSNLLINGGTITAESGMANTQSVGCACMNKFLMQGGELTAVGNGVSGIFTFSSSAIKFPSAVRCFGVLSNSRQESVEIRGGTVTAKAGNARAALGISTAFRSNSDLNISGGSFTAETDDMGDQNIGVDNQGTLIIGEGIKKFAASGTKTAVSGAVITVINGEGYSDFAGTKDKTAVKGHGPMQTMTFKKLLFPAPVSFSFSGGK